ncbi:hypothetical protein [Acinetobacter pittii]|uniref:hypothetical protein n=1 Tax=Acinetobacter pittii TaxID=48296 RepID=UPI0024DE2DE9|nr:hypothetical protein [Acinetobacter pittii]
MGYYSDRAIEQNEEAGLSGLDKTICVECINDKYLAKLVLENAVSKRCSYCDKNLDQTKLQNIIL